MSKCTTCLNEMSGQHTSCIDFKIFNKKTNTTWTRLPYGTGSGVDAATHNQDYCHDCNVAPGQFHHEGCDSETCPSCEGQFISCDCDLEYEDRTKLINK